MKATVLNVSCETFKPIVIEVVIETEHEAVELCDYLGKGRSEFTREPFNALVKELEERGILRD